MRRCQVQPYTLQRIERTLQGGKEYMENPNHIGSHAVHFVVTVCGICLAFGLKLSFCTSSCALFLNSPAIAITYLSLYFLLGLILENTL